MKLICGIDGKGEKLKLKLTSLRELFRINDLGRELEIRALLHAATHHREGTPEMMIEHFFIRKKK